MADCGRRRLPPPLPQEWLEQQEAIKNEPLEVTYSYWDGAGHRRKIVVRLSCVRARVQAWLL
jgi:hypothetical protein